MEIEITNKQTHYYVMGGIKRFENAKEVYEFMGSKSKTVFNNFREKGFLERILITSDEVSNTIVNNENR